MILLLVLLSALIAVPMAYVLLWVARGNRKRGRVGDPPWCEGCGYSMAGLDASAPCPECGKCRVEGRIVWRVRRARTRGEGRAPWCVRCGYSMWGLNAAAPCSECGEKKQAGSEPLCAECGYSLEGLSPHARCPECAGVKRARPWPNGWGVAAWVGLSQLPPLMGIVRLIAMGSPNSGPTAEGVAIILAIVAVPAAVALWTAWVVSRAGVRWLSVGALLIVAGIPLLAGVAAVLTARPTSGGFFFGPELGVLLAVAVGPLVTALSLALFSVCAVVTAAVMETTALRRA